MKFVESGAELLFALGCAMSGSVLKGTLVGSMILPCADTEGFKYEVGEYNELASATDVKPP